MLKRFYHKLMERYHSAMFNSLTDYNSDLAVYHFNKSFSHYVKSSNDSQVDKYQKALFALLSLANESEADIMVDIIIDALNGFDEWISEHFSDDIEKGIKYYQQYIE